MLGAISTITDIISAVIAVRDHFDNRREGDLLDKIVTELKRLNKRVLTKDDFRRLVVRLEPSRQIPPMIASSLLGVERETGEATRVLEEKIRKETGSYPKSGPTLVCSSFGTVGYIALGSDGKSIGFFHANGDDAGQCFVARKGIGWFFQTYLGGANSFLGFAVSDEYLTNVHGRHGARSDFEGGYIEFFSDSNELRVYRSSSKGSRCVLTHKFRG